MSVASAGRIGAGAHFNDQASHLSRPQDRLRDRKPAAGAAPQHLTATAAAEKSDIELDQDLFFPAATQLGHENETVRNLLIDAEHKIGELELIKNSIGKLVDPVSKTLRAYEETKNEKLSLKKVLNTTRIAQNKLREDLTNAEKRPGPLKRNRCGCGTSWPRRSRRSPSRKDKADQLAELSARRCQIAELQRHVRRRARICSRAARKPPARRARRRDRQADGAA